MSTLNNISAKERQNPFAEFGVIVTGARFIGRHDELQVIHRQLLSEEGPTNLAIIGNYRIGKSSLVYKGLTEQQDELRKLRRLAVRLNLGTFADPAHFFEALVVECCRALKTVGSLLPDLTDQRNEISGKVSTGRDVFRDIQLFFEDVHRTGWRMIFILDEFDHARKLFAGSITGFQRTRDLTYYPDSRVNFVTMSRRSLRSIELQTGGVSYLDPLFNKHYLGMFNIQDLEAYMARLAATGINVTEEMQKTIFYYCGRHPYLLDLLCYRLVENFFAGEPSDVWKAGQQTDPARLTQYEHIVNSLREDNHLELLLQLLFGPKIDVSVEDINEFLRYGLISHFQEGDRIGYRAFSPHFHAYLQLLAREVELWPILGQTERALRSLITEVMNARYGEKWITALESTDPNLKKLFEGCRKKQRNEDKTFEGRASQNLLDYTYPFDLFRIIFAAWPSFESKLGQQVNYWASHAQLLAKVRSPMAHFRDEVLTPDQCEQAKGFCGEILRKLQVKENLTNETRS